ncbi:DUF2946 family protein [Roseibium litorale]|uniref:DUF2946 family protein n=1 Tax=Roseibium litorale TaxID=2803841 RepID=A0ABR9CS56_9HYPH|nr:DUF2946 family protein [Roseibium litorale]MBD8893112.1 DUF2946 family protein [Roseibium litorale]
MSNRDTFMRLLRKERHPLAVLGMLAMAMRIVILVLGTSAAADPASAGIFVTCQNLAQAGEDRNAAPASQPHQADHCICGPVCAHAMHTAALLPKTPSPVLVIADVVAARPELRHRNPPSPFGQITDPIRGPPVSLT